MNCLECGHFIHMHSQHLRACQKLSCKCGLTPEEIELHHWRNEAMAARAIVEKIELLNTDVKEVSFTRSFVKSELRAYLAARVPNATETR